MQLALNILHDSTLAGLEWLMKEHGVDTWGTIGLLKIARAMWDGWNVKNPRQGFWQRNKDAVPYTLANLDAKRQRDACFVTWMDESRATYGKDWFLTADTHWAIAHNLCVFVCLHL